jgi:Sec-independent protein translocase protein TatA
VILLVAVLIFGNRLPEAASKAYLQFRKLRQSVDDMRRDTGIDRELRNIERSVREATYESRLEPRPPLGERAARAAPFLEAPAPAVAPPAAAPEPGPPPAGVPGEDSPP